MPRNRRKPKVVIPTNVEQLIATGIRVAQSIRGSVIETVADTGELAERISSTANTARTRSDAARIAYETSQEHVRRRASICEQLKDRLIQIRDYAYATEGRTSPGTLGFEVVQTTSNDGRARVLIPANPDVFLALALRVNTAVLNSGNASLEAMIVGMAEQIQLATIEQSQSIRTREEWQLLLDERGTSTVQLTNLLREVRDLAFAAAGPYRYERVSTTGLVVQSSATQGDGNGQPVENWNGDSNRISLPNDIQQAIDEITNLLGGGPYPTDQICEFFNEGERKSLHCELAQNADPNQTGSFTREQLLAVASHSPFTPESRGERRLLADVVLAWAELQGLTVQDVEPLNNDERVLNLRETQAVIFANHGTIENVSRAFQSTDPPPRTARLDDVIEAFLACERSKNGPDDRDVEDLVAEVLAQFPEASRDQFAESDWLNSAIALSADFDEVTIVNDPPPGPLPPGIIGTITPVTTIFTGCAFNAYDDALSTTLETTTGGTIQFFEFPPLTGDQVITSGVENGTHELENGETITIDDSIVTAFDFGPNAIPVLLDVNDLSERFRACLTSSFDGVPRETLSDGTPIPSAEEIATGIAERAGILEDSIGEQEFLANLPFGELAAFCGQFAWNFVRDNPPLQVGVFLDINDLSERFVQCLRSTFGGNTLPDGTVIGSVEAVTTGIAQSAGILADSIGEQEFLANLPYGDDGQFCGTFAWEFVLRNQQPQDDTFNGIDVNPASFAVEDLVDALGDPAVTLITLPNIETGTRLNRQQWIDLIESADLSTPEEAATVFDQLESDFSEEILPTVRAEDLVEYLDDPAVTLDALLGVEAGQLLTREQFVNLIISSELSTPGDAGDAFDGFLADQEDGEL